MLPFYTIYTVMKNNEKDKNLTVLGKETVFNGTIKFDDNLHIEGIFNGAIDAKGFLYVAKGAVCKVEYIKAASIVIEGTVYGPMTALGDVELKANSHVIGDIVANRLKISDNVLFDGEIHIVSNRQVLSSDVFSLDIAQFKEGLESDSSEKASFNEEA